MTRRVISVTPADPLSVAREHFRANNIHHLLVVERGRVVGVMSVREIIGKPSDATVGSVMARNVMTVGPESSTRDVATAMIGRGHGCVPVMEGGRVVGIVTTTDLLRAIA
ncbi:MAG TPA: CBS domain-containing protein [Thermoanaerobaculia bacterium]|nr:CBS domain-containing protein [Thermoanaerobaculia bacterium]